MHGTTTLERPDRQANDILDELGPYIGNVTALLRAAVNTGAGEREDESWLIGMAYDQMVAAKRRYMELCGVPEGAAQ